MWACRRSHEPEEAERGADQPGRGVRLRVDPELDDGRLGGCRLQADDTKISDCKATDFHCYEQAFANVSYNDGPKTALDQFDQDIKSPGPIERDCHRIAHAIGAGALSHFHGNIGQAFVAGRPSCTSGYYHGILERAFLGVPQGQLGAKARQFCSSPQVRKSEFIAYQCVHGLGHGLMIYTGYDLPLSLHTCDKLQQGDALSCTAGCSGELPVVVRRRLALVEANNLIYPCNAVAERYKCYCYDLVTARILPKVNYNWKKAAAWCRKSEKNWVKVCFQSMGRDASGYTRLDPARILRICRAAGNMARECIYAAAEDMTYTDVSSRRAKNLCNTAPGQPGTTAGSGSARSSARSAPRRRSARRAATSQRRTRCTSTPATGAPVPPSPAGCGLLAPRPRLPAPARARFGRARPGRSRAGSGAPRRTA